LSIKVKERRKEGRKDRRKGGRKEGNIKLFTID
jgi:hypothetical protein